MVAALMRVAVVRAWDWCAGGTVWGRLRGHEGEDYVQDGGADEGEAVYVAEVEGAGDGEEGAEEEEEEDWAGEVGVIHYVWWYWAEGVENRKGL